MQDEELTAGPGETPAMPCRRNRPSRFPTRTALVQATLLVAVAVGSAWLLHRSDSNDQSKHLALEAKAQAELVAHAVQEASSSADPHRLLRILECSIRGGNILAAAVLDSSGTVVAHTNLSRTGTKIEAPSLLPGSDGSELASSLFGKTSGELVVRPLLSSNGETGVVALLLPDDALAGTARRWILYLFPAALVMLAFFAVNRSAIRSALKPASDGLDKLASAVGWRGDPEQCPAATDVKYGQVIQDTVSRIQALTQSNDELMVTNRLFKFENKRMKMILDHFPDGLIVMDVLGKTAFMNKKAVRTLGLPADDERTWSPEEPPVEVLRTIREVDKAGQVLISFGEEEARREILCSRIPMTTSAGKSMATLYALRDVTAQNSAVKAQAEFLSQITHELKAPLNTVLAYTDMLSDDSELNKEERREFHNTLTSEAHRMGQLISNLLQLSRIQLGDLSGRFSLIKPGTLIKDQVDSIKIQAEDNGLRLDLHVPENLASIRGDKDLLGVAVTNLISNALKYTPQGGSIRVRAVEEDEGILFEVKDTGVGIPDEILPNIFDRFFRSNQELVQQKPGSGLGLALVKEIVELHNGRITVESSVKSGTRFQIWLPALEVASKLNATEALT
jgi:two-component system phosphate regulon sensor histidine kinase PhoR